MKLTNDFWRHLGIGLAGAVATAAFGFLTKQDWTAFGPYAGMIQLGVQMLAEGVNQALAKAP
ncbi:MAG: hypothetical protein ACLPGW_14135 [Roseiarcus sp.]